MVVHPWFLSIDKHSSSLSLSLNNKFFLYDNHIFRTIEKSASSLQLRNSSTKQARGKRENKFCETSLARANRCIDVCNVYIYKRIVFRGCHGQWPETDSCFVTDQALTDHSYVFKSRRIGGEWRDLVTRRGGPALRPVRPRPSIVRNLFSESWLDRGQQNRVKIIEIRERRPGNILPPFIYRISCWDWLRPTFLNQLENPISFRLTLSIRIRPSDSPVLRILAAPLPTPFEREYFERGGLDPIQLQRAFVSSPRGNEILLERKRKEYLTREREGEEKFDGSDNHQ